MGVYERNGAFVRVLQNHRKGGRRWSSDRVMVSVLPKEKLTHEGLLLGEAHLAHEGPKKASVPGPARRDREPGPGSMTSGTGSQVPEV